MSKLNLSSLFHKIGEDEKAIEYSLSAINEKDKSYSRFNIKAFENLAIIYEGMKDYQNALKYYKKYTINKDSITSENINSKIESLELSLENERIKTKNALLEKEKEVNEVKRERQKQVNILTFVITFIILTAAFVILMINIKKRRAEKELFIKTEENSKNEILSLMKAKEMQSMNSYMNGQEEERKRIASDLHDRLGSLFSTVKLYFSGLQSKFKDADESTKKTFKTIITLVDQSVDEVRAVSHNLAKDIVVQFGLIKAVKDIELAVNSSAQIKMKVIDNNFRFRFDKESEMQIYKALQEMITNAIRHSRAKNIIVQFTSINENEANIIVEDDGIGIDKRKVQGGIGMKNIHDRLNTIGADYNIDSSPESGTTFIINVKNQ
jgi:signal transduction histidine kinase